MYGDTIDLNTVTQKVGIKSQFMQNAKANGIQAAQSLDRIARNKLFAAYARRQHARYRDAGRSRRHDQRR